MFDSRVSSSWKLEDCFEIGGNDAAFLREPKRETKGGVPFKYVDLFAGCEGMSIGVEEALRDAGLRSEIAWAVDNDVAASAVYSANFNANRQHVGLIQDLLNPPGAAITDEEKKLAGGQEIDLLAGRH